MIEKKLLLQQLFWSMSVYFDLFVRYHDFITNVFDCLLNNMNDFLFGITNLLIFILS